MRVSQFYIPSVVLAVASFALVRCSFGPSAYSGELPGPPPDAGSGNESGGEGGDAGAGGDATGGNDATAESGSDATTGNDAATEGGDATAIDAAASPADGGAGG